jgi:hypothetical protein
MLPPIRHLVEVLQRVIYTAFLEARVDHVSVGVHIRKHRPALHLRKELFRLGEHPVVAQLPDDVVEAADVHLYVPPGLAVEHLDGLMELALLEALVDHDIVGLAVHADEAGRGVVVDHGLPEVVRLRALAVFKEGLEQHVAGGGRHLEVPVEQRPVVLHGLLVHVFVPVALHEASVHDAVVDGGLLAELVKELEGLVPVVEADVSVDEVLVDD